MDDLILYNRALEATDVRALNTMSNRVTDFSTGEGGSSVEPIRHHGNRTMKSVYDLSGRPVKEVKKESTSLRDGRSYTHRSSGHHTNYLIYQDSKSKYSEHNVEA